MRHSKLFTAILMANLLGVASLAVAASATGGSGGGNESIETANGVSYVSGGVGGESQGRLDALAKDFNLKLVFALKSGAYLSDVKVVVTSTAGKTLIDATSAGPWFLAKLPGGDYQVVASYGGKAESRVVAVGAGKLKTVDFRWSTE